MGRLPAGAGGARGRDARDRRERFDHAAAEQVGRAAEEARGRVVQRARQAADARGAGGGGAQDVGHRCFAGVDPAQQQKALRGDRGGSRVLNGRRQRAGPRHGDRRDLLPDARLLWRSALWTWRRALGARCARHRRSRAR